jgi:hypothetical protein
MDFLTHQRILKSSKRFSDIYEHLNKNYSIKYHELFVLAAVIGFVNDKKVDVIDKNEGIGWRSNYLNNSQKASVYSIILNDKDEGKAIENFEKNEYWVKYTNLLEQYAEGGMEILVNDVFKNKWFNNHLSEDYTEYDIDIIKYALALEKNIPF